MKTKIIISSDDNFSFYHESFLVDEIREVNISITNPLGCCIEKLPSGDISARIGVSSKDMDKMAIAWVKERKLGGVFGGPVGQEFGSPDCDYN